MAKNMKLEEFIKRVVDILSREFENNEVKLERINKNNFIISLDSYEVKMTKELLDKLKSPYGIDKFILEELERQGFEFDRNRSQYIQYCFGVY